MDEVQEIKQRLDIVEVVSGYLTLKRAGTNMKANCPFHNEKSPSFMVSPERQTFRCFGCNEGGDVFTFIEKIEGLDFYNALKILADRAGVKLERQNVRYGNTEHKADKKTRLYEINDWAKKLFHKILVEHPKAAKARSYLEQRGLSEATINRFEIGYAPDSWDLLLKFLKSEGYKEDEAWQAGVAIRSEKGSFYDRFRGRIIFPINNIMGATIAFTSRVLDPTAKEAKYVNSAESPIYTKGNILYGLDKAKLAFRESGLAIVVEGNMDVIACHQAGFQNVVASSGTALTEGQLKILTRYTAEIAFCFDTDDAGQAAMKKAVALALRNDVSAKIIAVPPPFKDPDEAIKSDPENWTKAVGAAKPALEYWIDLLVRKDPDLSVLAKKKIAKEILPVIKMTYSEIEKESYIKYLAKKLAISEKSLVDVLQKTKSENAERRKKEAEGDVHRRELTLEERILGLAWFDFALLGKVKSGIIDLKHKDTPGFIEMIRRGQIEKRNLDPVESRLLDQLVIVLGDELDLNNNEALQAEIEFLAARLKREEREQIKADFARKIEEAESRDDRAETKKLIAEFSRLIK